MCGNSHITYHFSFEHPKCHHGTNKKWPKVEYFSPCNFLYIKQIDAKSAKSKRWEVNYCSLVHTCQIYVLRRLQASFAGFALMYSWFDLKKKLSRNPSIHSLWSVDFPSWFPLTQLNKHLPNPLSSSLHHLVAWLSRFADQTLVVEALGKHDTTSFSVTAVTIFIKGWKCLNGKVRRIFRKNLILPNFFLNFLFLQKIIVSYQLRNRCFE